MELEKLLEHDIIERVNIATPWVNPIVTPPKPNNPEEIRLCVDMRQANEAIVRERHPIPTIEDVLHQVNGAKVFSKLDLIKGYHQLTLDEESRPITTFVTHKGLFRYKRLSFGINTESEIFQNEIQKLLVDIPGAVNISDDVIIYSKTNEEHDQILELVLERFRERNLTLNKDKCLFHQESIKFFGYILTSKGIQVDDCKVRTIIEAKKPSNQTEVKSFLRLASYCSRFINNFATITKPLRELTKKNARFVWNNSHEDSFQQIKRSISDKKTLGYFDCTKLTELVVDASPFGLGAVLA